MKITVKAAGSLRVPMDGAPRKYIGPEPVEVPASPYYLRRLADGDLVRADNAGGASQTTRNKGGK